MLKKSSSFFFTKLWQNHEKNVITVKQNHCNYNRFVILGEGLDHTGFYNSNSKASRYSNFFWRDKTLYFSLQLCNYWTLYITKILIMSAAIPTEAELLESQKQRYDRQIRVWGAGNIYMLKHSNWYTYT